MADTQPNTVGKPSNKKAREGRSPGFPIIDLKKALERAEEFRLAEGKHSVPTTSTRKAWNLGDESVIARRTIAALGYFGLFNDQGVGEKRKVQLSDTALKILLDTRPESPERDELIKTVALNPLLHKELWNKWGHELPSDATIETFLVRDRGFSSSGAADLITEYKNTLAFAKLDQFGNMLDKDQTKLPQEATLTPATPAALGATPLFTPPAPKQGMLQEVFNLDEGPVTLTVPAALSAESYADLADQFELFLRRAKRRVAKDEPDFMK